MINANAESTPVRSTQVNEMLECLNSQIGRLHKAVDAIELRLTCVLQEDIPTKGQIAEDRKAMVPLADKIDAERCSIANAAYRIERIIERLEL